MTAAEAGPPPLPTRVLLDTSVLAPEPLWLWFLGLADALPAGTRPELLVSRGVIHELRPALRRVEPRLDRTTAGLAAQLRIESLTTGASDAGPAADGTAPRPHVLDPDDAHLDAAALALGVDALITDDVHAFAPLPDSERGYALLTADAFLCALVDAGASISAAHTRYQELSAATADRLGVAPLTGSASHRLRRSRARRFATRVVRALRRA